MPKTGNRGRWLAAFAVVAMAATSLALAGCDGKPEGTYSHSGGVVDGWPVWGHGSAGQRYSANTQITPENVKDLKLAWTYRTGDLSKPGEHADLAFEATPILANKTLYLCSPRSRIIALDPTTGKQKWMFDAHPHTAGATVIVCRGVSYWKDSQATSNKECSQRIFGGTIDGKMWALDADTGKPCEGFGDHGKVDLHQGLGFIEKPGLWGISSAPAIVGDMVITGSKIIDFHNTDMPGGVVRALDARSGKVVWAFTAAPPDMDQGDAAHYPRSAPNVWAPMSVDVARKLIFLPTGTPQVDSYIGKADWDYYGSSVVALNTDTGKPVWHYQFVHKDIWDYDTPSQPLLFDYHAPDGKIVPALAQATKMGTIFVLNRETGVPIFPVKETPVSTGGLQKGLSPTQPIPILPEHEVRITKFQDSDIFGFALVDKWDCLKRFHALVNDGIFTPYYAKPSVDYPISLGGMDWGGLTFDPQRNLLVVNSNNILGAHHLAPHKGSGGYSPLIGTPYRQVYDNMMSMFSAPCNAPPWGRLTGIDMTSGKKVWEVPLGTTRDEAPWPLWFPLGVPNQGGAITTASGLTFIAATTDRYFRAFETATGKELWRVSLPAAGQSMPMTYRLDAEGKQYVVLSAGGHSALQNKQGDYVIAYALP
ncbi:MAG TPA: pyrroloquinoline quinone-dependent dehydrogenase [Rhizomicrobium sp.]|nr:pyrroloquinoline quinone-dependent dehydrogenase [Rhizomicrobium sp.]